MIEAFDSATPEGSLLGTFSNPSDGQLMDCSPPAKSVIKLTHFKLLT